MSDDRATTRDARPPHCRRTWLFLPGAERETLRLWRAAGVVASVRINPLDVCGLEA
ncbi:MAG: hypothetical protein IPL88_16190 [Rhizobiales bacterium]|nr:hypothetical protein [Hyphomicrobiales bacterium]